MKRKFQGPKLEPVIRPRSLPKTDTEIPTLPAWRISQCIVCIMSDKHHKPVIAERHAQIPACFERLSLRALPGGKYAKFLVRAPFEIRFVGF